MDRWSALDAGRNPVPQNVIAEQTAIMEKYFGPNVPLPQREQVKHIEPSDAALSATFRIYKPRTLTQYTHGADADANGQIWFVMFDRKANKIARLDPRTDEFQELTVPTTDSGPHTMMAGRGGQINQNGLIYISQTYCNCLGVVDPKTNEYTEYKAMTPGSPHGIAIDSKGNVWINNTAIVPNVGQKLLKFDPKAKKLSEYVVPGPAPRPPDADSDVFWQANDKLARLAASVAPRGSSRQETQGWYSHSNCSDPEDKVWLDTGGNVVRFDPVTLETKFFTIPNSQTLKGMACPPDGNIWINSNTGHGVWKLDPRTGKTKFFPVPTPNGMPYGSVLDGRGRLWVADTAARSMLRIDLKTGEMTEYPIPDYFAVPSWIGVDPQGRAVFGEKQGGRVGILDPGDLK